MVSDFFNSVMNFCGSFHGIPSITASEVSSKNPSKNLEFIAVIPGSTSRWVPCENCAWSPEKNSKKIFKGTPENVQKVKMREIGEKKFQKNLWVNFWINWKKIEKR